MAVCGIWLRICPIQRALVPPWSLAGPGRAGVFPDEARAQVRTYLVYFAHSLDICILGCMHISFLYMCIIAHKCQLFRTPHPIRGAGARVQSAQYSQQPMRVGRGRKGSFGSPHWLLSQLPSPGYIGMHIPDTYVTDVPCLGYVIVNGRFCTSVAVSFC